VRYLVFARSDRHPWRLIHEAAALTTAHFYADKHVRKDCADRVCVMEVGGTDALPAFTLKYTTSAAATREQVG
jgi:hypothetical protein